MLSVACGYRQIRSSLMRTHWLFGNETAMPHCHKAIVRAGFEEEKIFHRVASRKKSKK